MLTFARRLTIAAALLAALGAVFSPAEAQARVRLKNICTVYGQKPTQIVGLGLVVGLRGTGDGGKNAATMRALASTLSYLNNPVDPVRELKDAANVAIVSISAEVPKEGLRRGQKIDCHVASMFGAKSLRGGRLLLSPMRLPAVEDDRLVGLASGPIYIEDSEILTSGRIPGGVSLEQDFTSVFVDRNKGNKITLLLEPAHATFGAASEVAMQINEEFRFEVGSNKLANAVSPGVIEVALPQQYFDEPVNFVALLLDVGIDNPQSESRVVVNSRSKTVVIDGDVEISPVVISHKGLRVEVGTEPGPFVALNTQGQETPEQLKDLVQGLEKLRVPIEDIISIIRELHQSGKLHAVYEEH
ncbi:MAG: flagellar basal body P-ring protein FlgI [Planctomycetaceae bacterium]